MVSTPVAVPRIAGWIRRHGRFAPAVSKSCRPLSWWAEVLSSHLCAPGETPFTAEDVHAAMRTDARALVLPDGRSNLRARMSLRHAGLEKKAPGGAL